MNSLEVRAPFLDKNVVELVNHFPIQFKFKGLERKFILKKLMEDKLPREIIYRKKKGFGMPIGEWIKGDMKPLIEEYLSKENINKMSLFDYSYIRKILDEHYTGKKDNRKQIWTLFVFAMWWKKWMI
jgi:asparagine synthase (glutamine-hydrolysing)